MQEKEFKTQDHPEANGRKPSAGEVQFTVRLPLEDGSDLKVKMGRKGRDTLFGMLIADCADSCEVEPEVGIRSTVIPSQETNPNGLHQRYKISKANGESVDPNAVYFVLRLDSLGDDKLHIEACRAAARAYADHIQSVVNDHEARNLAPTDGIVMLEKVASDLRLLVAKLIAEGMKRKR